MSAWTVVMSGNVEVVATVSNGPGAQEIARAIAAAIAQTVPDREVRLCRGGNHEAHVADYYRGEVVPSVRVRRGSAARVSN